MDIMTGYGSCTRPWRGPKITVRNKAIGLTVLAWIGEIQGDEVGKAGPCLLFLSLYLVQSNAMKSIKNHP